MAKKERRFNFLDDLQAEDAALGGEPRLPAQSAEPAETGQATVIPPESVPPAAPEVRVDSAPAKVEPQRPTQDETRPRPYLYEPTTRHEAQAPLGNRVRLMAKHHLEDYVRALKRAGHPATEGRVLEALMLLLDDEMVRARVNAFLTGQERLQD